MARDAGHIGTLGKGLPAVSVLFNGNVRLTLEPEQAWALLDELSQIAIKTPTIQRIHDELYNARDLVRHVEGKPRREVPGSFGDPHGEARRMHDEVDHG